MKLPIPFLLLAIFCNIQGWLILDNIKALTLMLSIQAVWLMISVLYLLVHQD
jgi:hypothetical protein